MLENLGLKIDRYTLCYWDQPLVDDAGKAEQHRTHVVLGIGGMGLLLTTLRTLLTRPAAWWQGVGLRNYLNQRSVLTDNLPHQEEGYHERKQE